jgi:hypothetical protein
MRTDPFLLPTVPGFFVREFLCVCHSQLAHCTLKPAT